MRIKHAINEQCALALRELIKTNDIGVSRNLEHM